MTWSIVARDASGAFGVAVASRFFAVGALCPHARSGVGALSTQALVNPLYAEPGLDLLAQGIPAAEVVRMLTAADARPRASRQLHVIDREGRTAAHTGTIVHRLVRASRRPRLLDRGQHAGRTARARRNRGGLSSAARRLPFAERLLAALDAGDAAGGDKRGKQAAALLDLHDRGLPVPRSSRRRSRGAVRRAAQRLYEKSLERFQPVRRLPAQRASGPRASPIARQIEEAVDALPGGTARSAGHDASARSSRPAHALRDRGRRVRGGRRRQLHAARPGARSASSANRAAARASPRCRSWASCRSRRAASSAARSCSRARTCCSWPRPRCASFAATGSR